ncbi:phospholipase D family protein [Aquibacillus kalidii]|uniref:phospholipase D family protein n=1 Tax=Aquibacillus kalidii TaxID=2762597 RepID=UPI001646B5D3|nr:phospholipase D family protein [Aquibacillus kalidii]
MYVDFFKKQTKNDLCVAIYTFDNEDSKEIFQKLQNENIQIKVNQSQKMHLKLTISDSQTVVTGSYNFTEKSAEDNQAHLITIQNENFADIMNQTFEKLWERTLRCYYNYNYSTNLEPNPVSYWVRL